MLHIVDDVLLLASAAVGSLEPLPPLVPAEHVRGWVLTDACRYFEFRIIHCDNQAERAVLTAEVIHTGRLRDFFGFNRAKHAVVDWLQGGLRARRSLPGALRSKPSIAS